MISIPTTSARWAKHVEKWQSCKRCLLCYDRDRICLARGKLPCDVLVCGEAPGESENALGLPFVGPAGRELDSWIEAAQPGGLRFAFTNVVGCFPAEAKQTGDHRPPAAAIKACRPRLIDLISIAAPRLIVLVGDTAQKHIHEAVPRESVRLLEIVHPAAVLRAPMAQQTLMIRRATIQLSSAFQNLLDF